MGRHIRGRGTGRTLCVALAAVVALLAIVMPGVAGAASATPSPGAGKIIFRYGQLEPWISLNPFLGTAGVSYQIYLLNYGYLLGSDPGDASPIPNYAESWSASPDGKTWTFKIREGLTWQDGQPATARDVAFTFNYVISNEMWAYTMYTEHIKRVVAVDDYTVEFICDSPKGDILDMYVPILPEHIWSKVSAAAAQKSFRNGPPSIGSGPFEAVEAKTDQYVKMVANNDYWRGAPAIDELLIETYKSAVSMIEDLKLGRLDAVSGVPEGQFAALGSVPGITTNRGTSWSFTQITFNCYDSPDSKGNPVLLDQAFRQALQYAVDREEIARTAFGTYADPGQVLLQPYSRFVWKPPAGTEYTFDPERAKTMLEAAGYKDTDGDGFRETKQGKAITLRLYAVSDTPPDVAAARMVVAMFAEVGINVRFEVLDQAGLTDRVWAYEGDKFTPDFDMFLYWWLGAPDPQFVLSLLTPGQLGSWSDTSWTDPEYTKLFEQESATVDEQERIALVQDMQRIVWEASPYIILNYPQRLEAYRTDKWDGWVAAPSAMEGTSGAVVSSSDNLDSFLMVHPKATAAAEGGGVPSWIYGLVAVAVALAAIVLWLVLRRRGRAVEEG